MLPLHLHEKIHLHINNVASLDMTHCKYSYIQPPAMTHMLACMMHRLPCILSLV